jgi:enoyl-CoA hydratase/carnithine racemase
MTMNEILTERTDGVLRIALNRPHRKNAMTGAMYDEVARLLGDAALDEGVRVVLLHGAGDAFTAGNDIEDFLNTPPDVGESPQSRLMYALLDFDKPLVAAVHGVAIGAGTTMLAHFDFVYAAEATIFQTPMINLALVPEFGSSFTFPRLAGHAGTAELLLLGRKFDAPRAEALGLVTRIVPERDLMTVARDTAAALAAKPAGALRAAKALLKEPVRERIRQAMRDENLAFARRLGSAESKEALTAFIEKRPPNFTSPATPAVPKAA